MSSKGNEATVSQSDPGVRWSPYGGKGPWKVRVLRRLLSLLGVEVRIEYRLANAPEGGWPKEFPGQDALGEWDDCQAHVTTWVECSKKCGDPPARLEIRPFLYVRTAADRKFEREIDSAMRVFVRRGGEAAP